MNSPAGRPVSLRSVVPAILASCLVLGATAALAQDARQIMVESQQRANVESERYEGGLVVVDAKGKSSEKHWTFERLGSHGRSKAVLRFTAPAEVKGVALLIVNYPDRASDQWMWTPAIERDRRIATQDRSTRFFGTDFSFEDLEERDVDQFDYRLLGEETIDGTPCWKIESTPRKTRASQYSRSTAWIRKDHYTTVRIEAYAKNALVRRIVYSGLRQVQNVWTATVIEVTELARGSRTRLTLDKLEYNVPLQESAFTLQALRR